MEDEADEVACAEEDGVGAGREAGEILTVDDDDPGEAEVDLLEKLLVMFLIEKAGSTD